MLVLRRDLIGTLPVSKQSEYFEQYDSSVKHLLVAVVQPTGFQIHKLYSSELVILDCNPGNWIFQKALEREMVWEEEGCGRSL